MSTSIELISVGTASMPSLIAVGSDFNLLARLNHIRLSSSDIKLLKKFKNGSFKVTIDLETEQEYQFKYLVDGEKWVNDEMADKYVSNGIGHEENSVVVL